LFDPQPVFLNIGFKMRLIYRRFDKSLIMNISVLVFLSFVQSFSVWRGEIVVMISFSRAKTGIPFAPGGAAVLMAKYLSAVLGTHPRTIPSDAPAPDPGVPPEEGARLSFF